VCDFEPEVRTVRASLSRAVFSKASVAVPVKLGVSLSNYDELDGTDHKFGFFSIAGIVTVPLGSPSKFGSWNLHGGAEFQTLGDTTKFFNGGDGSQAIGSIGIGFSY
jgi:hypothetical protein